MRDTQRTGNQCAHPAAKQKQHPASATRRRLNLCAGGDDRKLIGWEKRTAQGSTVSGSELVISHCIPCGITKSLSLFLPHLWAITSREFEQCYC